MFNDLLLLSGMDIPFSQAQIVIHQPKIKEIALIGEEAFFLGCEMLNFSKDLLSFEDQENLKDKTNFDVFMMIINSNDLKIKKNKIYVNMILSLIFPNYKIKFNRDSIEFVKEGDEPKKINNSNFESFKDIISDMFCLKKNEENKEYNPAGNIAAKIAAKLKKGRVLAAKAKGEHKKKFQLSVNIYLFLLLAISKALLHYANIQYINYMMPLIGMN